MTRRDMSGWHPADEASRATLLYLQKWQRRDMYFYGSFAVFFVGLALMSAWSALNGSPWSWATMALDVGLVALYGWKAHIAFGRWQTCQEILSEPNPD